MNNPITTRSVQSIIFLACLTLASCSTSTSTSNNNNNTSGCGKGILCANVNGTSYVAEAYNPAGDYIAAKTSGSFARLQVPYYTLKFRLDVYGDNAPQPQQSIEIGVSANTMPTVGTAYGLISTTVGVELDYYKFDATDLVFYDWRADAHHAGSTGTLTLTKIDTVANLVSGTFSFSAKEINVNTTHDSSTVTVTNGSFTDLKLTR